MATKETPSPSTESPATDSPWFWACLFCGFGLSMLVAMSPKYAARQQQIEQTYHMQQHVYYGRPTADNGPFVSDRPLIITLRPLLAIFAGLFLLGGVALWIRSRPGSPPPVDQGESS